MGGMMMGRGNVGQVTEINGDSLTLKTQTGAMLTVKTTGDTRFVGKDRNPAALKDLKVGDYVAAGGPVTDGVVQARFVAELDESAIQRMQEFQANLGKTVIAGEVKEIADAKLTILRPDGQTQVIELDEGTSLRRRQESITLADVKVGDRVRGNGELKGGIFVPKELQVMSAGMRRMREPDGPPAPPK
jgi:predicted nucleotide-binding protein